jgi:hypothetical protein
VIPTKIAFNRKALAIVVPRKFIKGLNPINKFIEKKMDWIGIEMNWYSL